MNSSSGFSSARLTIKSEREDVKYIDETRLFKYDRHGRNKKKCIVLRIGPTSFNEDK